MRKLKFLTSSILSVCLLNAAFALNTDLTKDNASADSQSEQTADSENTNDVSSISNISSISITSADDGNGQGYSNGLQGYNYYVTINYKKPVSSEQATSDMKNMQLLVETPTSSGTRQVRLPNVISQVMSQNNSQTSACLEGGSVGISENIYPDSKVDLPHLITNVQNTKGDSSYYYARNGVRLFSTDNNGNVYDSKNQRSGWLLASDGITPSDLFVSDEDYPGKYVSESNDNSKARFCIDNDHNNPYASGIYSSQANNFMMTSSQPNTIAETSNNNDYVYYVKQKISIHIADFTSGQYNLGYLYIDGNNNLLFSDKQNPNSGSTIDVKNQSSYSPNLSANLCESVDIDSNATSLHYNPGAIRVQIKAQGVDSLKLTPTAIDIEKLDDVKTHRQHSDATAWSYGNVDLTTNYLQSMDNYKSTYNTTYQDTSLNNSMNSYVVGHDYGALTDQLVSDFTNGTCSDLNDNLENCAASTMIQLNPESKQADLYFWDATDNENGSMQSNIKDMYFIDKYGNTWNTGIRQILQVSDDRISAVNACS